jgi:hypothetical protein
VKSALQLHAQMKQAHLAVDKHIQETIRTAESTFSKQAATWGITAEDRLKNLAPVMNRAFSTNFQCKAIQKKAADRLQDSLELLAKKFNSREAEAGAAQLDRG